jgi:hypothetical protein
MGERAGRREATFLVALLTLGLCLTAQTTPTAADLTDAEMEQFLRQGEVKRQRTVSTGINQTKRLELQTAEIEHDAHFNEVDVRKPRSETPWGTELNFRDYYGYNIAAYRLDRLIGLNMVPVTIERRISRSSGSVAWWVDDVQMMEKERFLKKIEPPDLDRWNDQIYQARVFNELVYNADANLGNLLITNDWQLKMVDFTRAFRDHKKLRNVDNLTRIDRRVWNGLRRLDEAELQRELKGYVTKSGLRGIMARRDLIVQYFEAEIANRGEAAVVCDMPGH